MPRRKQYVRDVFGLEQLPDDEFMRLLEELGEGPVVKGPRVPPGNEYTPEEIEAELARATLEAPPADG